MCSWPPRHPRFRSTRSRRPAGAPTASRASTCSTPWRRCRWWSWPSRTTATEETRSRFRALCEHLDKTVVEVPDVPGFVVNRLLFPYLFSAVRLRRGDRPRAEGDRHLHEARRGPPDGAAQAARLRRPRRVGGDRRVDRRRRARARARAWWPRGAWAASRAPASTTTTDLVQGAGPGQAACRWPVRGGVRPAARSQTTSASPMPCSSRQPRDALPRQLGVGQVVPAGVVERLERAGEGRAELPLCLDQRADRITLGVAELDAPHRADLRRYARRGGRNQAPSAAWRGSSAPAASAAPRRRRSAARPRRRSWSRIRTASIRFSRTDSTRSE